MSLNKSNISLLRYIQEKKEISLRDIANQFDKNDSTIRREIELINQHSTKLELITIYNGVCSTNLSYIEFVDFIGSLEMYDYSSDNTERVKALIVGIFFNGYVNATRLYNIWQLSVTTKKNDTSNLRLMLAKYDLKLVVLKKRGLAIVGDELRFRLLVIQILLPLIELNENGQIKARIANTPVENFIYHMTENALKLDNENPYKEAEKFIADHDLILTYPSRKLIHLYFISSMFRMKTNKVNFVHTVPVSIFDYHHFKDIFENNSLNQVISMLDIFPIREIRDERLKKTVEEFISSISKKSSYNFYPNREILNEFVAYIHKQICVDYFDFILVDKMVRNTKQFLPYEYSLIENCVGIFDDMYKLKFNDEQYSTMTLLLKKWIIKSRIIGEGKVKIIIVTSSSFERISYFVTELKEHLEVELVGVLTLSEIYRLKDIQHDKIIAFSDRITNELNKMGFDALKVGFFIKPEDIGHLLKNGFSQARRRFITDKFVNELKGIEEARVIDYLKEKYADYFI